MLKGVLLSAVLAGALHAEWIMFADKEDTYLYNNLTGEVYIRHKQKKENYKDFFVRMPSGVIPDANGALNPKKSSPSPSTNTKQISDTLNQEAAKRMTQEALKQVGDLLYEGN